jgi:hypothetical protein
MVLITIYTGGVLLFCNRIIKYSLHYFFIPVLFVTLNVFIKFMIKAGNMHAVLWVITAVSQTDPIFLVLVQLLTFGRDVLYSVSRSNSPRWLKSWAA